MLVRSDNANITTKINYIAFAFIKCEWVLIHNMILIQLKEVLKSF